MRRAIRAAAVMAMMSGSVWAGAPDLKAPAPQQPPAAEAQPAKRDGRPTLEVVFVLDTTSSMTGLIEGAKQKIWSIASRMASGKPTPRIRVGLVAYRDVGDEYVTKKFDLSEDLDAVYKNLQGLSAEGGGDTPEHVGKGIAEAVTAMSWSQDTRAAKMMFVVGDAPSQHYGDGFDAEVWTKRAIAKGIVVNTIRCGADETTQREFAALSRLADGTFVSIDQSGGMLAVATPFDAEIGKLNGALAGKALIGGTAHAREEGRAAGAAMAAMPAAVAADRIAFKTRTEGPKAKLAAPSSVAGAFDFNDVPAKAATASEDELPDALRTLKPAERAAFVEKNAKEKAELENQLTELAKKRDGWLAQNAKPKADSFDEKVFDAVKRQAKKVDVTY